MATFCRMPTGTEGRGGAASCVRQSVAEGADVDGPSDWLCCADFTRLGRGAAFLAAGRGHGSGERRVAKSQQPHGM